MKEIYLKFKVILAMCLLIAIQLMLAGCSSSEENQPREPEVSAPPPELEIAITSIDGTQLPSQGVIEVGRQVIVEGTISDRKAVSCVMVHPMTTPTWWVQSLPAPPDKVDDHTWRWRLMALCGTEELGTNEEYQIVAIAESRRAVCQAGKQIKMEEFPESLPRSEIVTVTRIGQ